MQKLARWGNSLAVRIPADLARNAGLQEGDAVELRRGECKQLILEAVRSEEEERQRRLAALEAIRHLGPLLPADFKFDREEANAR